MKIIKKILFGLFIFLSLPFMIEAKEEVNIYLFHANWCGHCKEEIIFLNKIENEYDNIKIIKYEVSENTKNSNLMVKVKKELGVNGSGVPFTVIGEKVITGFGDENSTGKTIRLLIDYYSDNSHRDLTNEIITNGKLINQIKSPENLDILYDDEEVKRQIPILGEVDAKKVSLPLLAVVLGMIDGFNPCAMWVLLFLISMLIGTKDKKKMWTIGLTFIGTSALVYLLFMTAWLQIVLSVVEIRLVMIMIALFALFGGGFNVYTYFRDRNKDSGCQVVDENKRHKIFKQIRNFTSQKNMLLAILGTIALAFTVNLIEMACSFGLPATFTYILAINELSILETSIYIFIYILFFLLDDLIIFLIAMKTLSVTGMTTKYSKYSHLIGGIIMVIIGLLLLFNPGLLMS
ncbi:MAG: thioredoxin domain-containing protein [Bacilli bacterium]|nr:thioredoxin domain-containing protein [Bacilli bacterium]MDD4809339.1 thioredoxin domain-containing protein [Bacilli bacterium]